MAQMYKVFIQDKVILFSSELTNNQQEIDLKKLESIEQIENQFKEGNELIVVGDVDKSFKKFKKQFDLIEAAGGLVKNSNGELLMIYRNNFWDLPKGKLEKNEQIEECAVREVEEECGVGGLKITGEAILTYHLYVNPYTGNDVIKRTYWYPMLTEYSEELVPQIEEGITKVEWVNFSKINSYADEMFALIRDLIFSSC